MKSSRRSSSRSLVTTWAMRPDQPLRLISLLTVLLLTFIQNAVQRKLTIAYWFIPDVLLFFAFTVSYMFSVIFFSLPTVSPGALMLLY